MYSTELTDDTFARLVSEDIKGKATELQQSMLREEPDRWRRAVVLLLENLDGQLAEISRNQELDEERYKDHPKLIIEAQMAWEEKRKKIKRFQFFVEQKLTDIDRVVALGDEALTAEDKLSTFLRRAIQKHRELIVDGDYEPTSIDEALWSALDGRWGFSDLD